MKKKLCSLLIATLLATSLFTACGGARTDNSATKTDDTKKTDVTAAGENNAVTISYLETQPTEAKTALTKKMLDAFMAKYPNIKIEFQSSPNDQARDKLLTLAAGNKLPDVVEINDSWLAPLASSGNLADLNSYIEKWEEKDNIVDAAYKLGRVMDNKLYYIPYGLYGTAVYYNKAMLEATGKKAPETTAEFYDVAKAMTNETSGKYGYSFRGGMYGPTHAVMWMLGEIGSPDIFDANGKCVFDTPKAIEGLTKYAALYKDKVSPPDSTNWAFRECVAGFTSGVTGLLIQSNEVVQICNEKMGEGKFDTVHLPVGASGKAYDTSGQTGYAMSGKTKNSEAAWKLLSYLLSAEGSREFSIGMGFTPVNKKLADDPAFTNGPIKVYLDQVMSDNIEFSNNPSYLPEWGDFCGAWGTAEIQKMILNQQTPEQTAKNLADFLNTAKEKYDSKK